MTGTWNVTVAKKSSCSNASRKGEHSSGMLRGLLTLHINTVWARNLPWCFLLRLLPSFRNLELSWRATSALETRDSGNWKTGHLKHGNGVGRGPSVQCGGRGRGRWTPTEDGESNSFRIASSLVPNMGVHKVMGRDNLNCPNSWLRRKNTNHF